VFERRVIVLACVLLLAGCATPGSATRPPTAPLQATPSQEPLELWPLPDDPMGLARAAGLEPLTIESLEYHVHAHLDVFMDGRPVLVPAGIGIDIEDPAVKRFDDPAGVGYGGIEEPCEDPCISPLHTHDPDGVIHTESPTPTPNTIGVPGGPHVLRCVDSSRGARDSLEFRPRAAASVEQPPTLPTRFARYPAREADARLPRRHGRAARRDTLALRGLTDADDEA